MTIDGYHRNEFLEQRIKTKTIRLHKAIKNNNLEGVRQLLQNGASVHLKNNYGETPLAAALQHVPDNIKIIKELIKYGADVNAKCDCRDTPIFIGLSHPEINIEAIRVLLTKGAGVKARDYYGNTPLHIALKKRASIELVRELLKCGNDVNIGNTFGMLPIVEAVRASDDNVEVIEELIKNGAYIKNVDRYGNSLMHVALYESKSLNFIMNILKYQSDLNIKNFRQETPIFTALSNLRNSLDIIKVLIKHGASVLHRNVSGYTPLHVAVNSRRDLNVIQEILNCSNIVNVKNKFGNTPIFEAVFPRRGNLDLVKELLKYGASVSIRDDGGATPLHFALRYSQHSGIIMEILHCNPDVNVKDDSGQTPIFCALQNDSVNFEIITELIKRGASCSESDIFGNTPLHVALRSRQSLQVIKEILKQGVDVNATNIYGETPIFGACLKMSDNLEIMKELFAHGAYVLVKNNIDQSPLHILMKCGKNFETIKDFLKQGGDMNSTDTFGNMPLAELTHNHELIWYLTEFTSYGASIHKNFRLVDILEIEDEYFVDELIKFALVEHPDDIVCIYCENLSRKFRRTALLYKREIERMKNEYIVNEFSLYDFVVNRTDYGKVFRKENDLVKEVNLSRELRTNFPIYYDVILSRLDTRMYYLRYFYDTKFLIKTDNRTIHLNSYCLNVIGKYLSKDDLINVLCAFSDQRS